MKLVVRQVTPTGKEDPKFGKEYIVHFEGDEREVRVSRKGGLVEGQELYGTVMSNAYGAYFKKDQYQPDAQGREVNTTEKKWTPMKKDNSDGMRQGMCMNNASNYLTEIAVATGESYETPEAWAKEVHKYASALYALGDLDPAAPLDTAPQNVQDAFKSPANQ